MLEWHGRGQLAEEHKEERIINGKKVMVTVCKPAEASGVDSWPTWDERIKADVIDAEETS